jgi:hypothetical protein
MAANTAIRKEIAAKVEQTVEQMMRGLSPELYRECVGRVKALKEIDEFIVDRNKALEAQGDPLDD